MLDRTKFLSVFNPIRSVIEDWQAGESPTVTWRGSTRKAISELVFTSWDSLFDAVSTDDVADELKATILAIDEFENHFIQWAEKCELQPDEGDPRGSSALWSAWSAVIESLTIYRSRKPESIQTLVAQKVSDRQIGLIYGWVDENGEVDTGKVEQEKRKPGTHYNPETWVSQHEIQVKAEIAKKWSDRQGRLHQRVADKQASPEAPETLDELIHQRVPSMQIAHMKRIDLDAVRQRAAELGIPLDGQFVRRVSPVDQLAELREGELDAETAIRNSMDQDSMEMQIIELHLEGQSPAEIAKDLSGVYPKLTNRKVASIIKSVESAEPTSKVS